MSNATVNSKWQVLALPGVSNDSLGQYLFALGLFSVASRRWPTTRSCWRDGSFVLLNGPQSINELADGMVEFAQSKSWRCFEPGWKDAVSKIKKQGTVVLKVWRSQAEEDEVVALDAHLVAVDSRKTNPMLDSRGGKRIFHKGWKAAASEIENSLKKDCVATTAKLNALLAGESRELDGEQFNAGSWFSVANKIYNHSNAAKKFSSERRQTSSPYNEGKVSPWEMVCACEGFEFLAGSSSRRLSLRSRAMAGFPFVVESESPASENLCGKSLAEFWAPVWDRVFSIAELHGLFARGRVALNGKGALTAAAISGAILDGGTDVGIAEFRRFALIETTSSKSFETRLQSSIPAKRHDNPLTGTSLSRIVALRDSLRPDRPKGKRWIFSGLRGPLDSALINFAEKPTTESGRAVLDAMIASLRAADRNLNHRRSKSASPPRAPISFQLLPGAWAASLLDGNSGDACEEARIGLALATLWATKQKKEAKNEGSTRLLPYWLGVEQRGSYSSIPESVPFRRVWGAGTLTANLVAVLQRRLIEEEPSAEPPFGSWYRVGLGDFDAWLSGALDDAEVAQWMMRFSLFDWNKDSVASAGKLLGHAGTPHIFSGGLTLFALFKPLYQSWLLSALLPAGSKREAAKVGPLPGITAQLARGDLTAAAKLAQNAYRAAGIEPAKIHSHEFACEDPQRLLAALLIPAERRGITEDTFDGLNRPVSALSFRWLSPCKQSNNP
jgi:CRISPR-associated protein Csx17